jgi:hypothetical protein
MSMMLNCVNSLSASDVDGSASCPSNVTSRERTISQFGGAYRISRPDTFVQGVRASVDARRECPWIVHWAGRCDLRALSAGELRA